MQRPSVDEYNSYYERYVSLVETSDIVGTLTGQGKDTVALLSGLGEIQGDYRYAPEKWSVKQLVGHVIDTERIFTYRALRISRNDATAMEGFEQDDYVRNGPFEHCSLKALIEEFSAVRRATVSLFGNLAPDACLRRGIASKNEVSVRAIAWITAGHELHHRQILREKYLRA